MKLLMLIAVLLLAAQSSNAQDCLSRDFNNGGTVCVCNAEHCDTFKPIEKVDESKFVKVTSNQAGLRFQKDVGLFEKQSLTAKNVIEIGTETYQEIFGFGGAFTDSTGINILSVSEDLGNKILSAYFSDDGIEYSVGRVPIGGTDFSLKGYSYCDTPNDVPDPELTNFSLQPEDFDYKISMIRRALKLRIDNKLDLFASAWVAPNWMKTIPGVSARSSYIKEDMYQPWADYFVYFLDSYKRNNISFWGITTGNEPKTALGDNKIPSVAWTGEEMTKWVRENLGPALRNSDHSDINLLIIDDQSFELPGLVNQILSDEKVNKFVDGIAIHWYGDSEATPANINATHEQHPDKFILATEACNGFMTNDVILGSWDRGVLYADSIMRDLNNWVTGWVDWNMALNLRGGPTFIGNYVDAPIIVNATAEEFYKQPMYYVLGHFSKFITKGSVRVKSSVIDEVVSTAATRPDGSTAVVMLNKNNKDVSVTVRVARRGDINVDLTANSITSIVYW